MTDLKFRILIDKNDLKKQIKNAVESTIGLSGGGKSSGKELSGGANKKTNGILSSIFNALGPVAVLLEVANILKVFEIITGFVLLAVLKIIKWISGLYPVLKEIWTNIVTKLKEGWQWLSELPGKIWEFMQTLPEKIWGFILSLPSLIWGYIVQGFNWIVGKLIEVKDWIVGKLIEGWNYLKEVPGMIWDYLVEGFNWLMDILTPIWDRLLELKDSIVEKLTPIWDRLLELKDSIVEKLTPLWDKLQEVYNYLLKLAEDIWVKIQPGVDLIVKVVGEVSAAISKLKFFSNSSSGGQSGDFISRPGQELQNFSPNDTIIGVKDTASIGSSKTFNFYGVTPQQMIDVINREAGKNINRGGRY